MDLPKSLVGGTRTHFGEKKKKVSQVSIVSEASYYQTREMPPFQISTTHKNQELWLNPEDPEREHLLESPQNALPTVQRLTGGRDLTRKPREAR